MKHYRMRIAVAMLLANIATVQAGTKVSVPAYISAAVDNPSRPPSDRERDGARLPAQVIAFAGIKPGDKIADLMPGRGYFTRIFCVIAGEKGHVYAVTVPRKVSPSSLPSNSSTGSSTGSSTSTSSPNTSIQSQASSAASSGESCTNVTPITLVTKNRHAPELHSNSDDPGWVYEYYQQSPAAENIDLPEPVDVIWTSENYHDLHNAAFGAPNMAQVTKSLFAALKPGGVLIVEDHAAEAKSGARDTQTLHRIDPKLVKREVLLAGFVFVGESKLLRHKDDNHTTKAHEMHDKTDRFLLKFRRPDVKAKQ